MALPYDGDEVNVCLAHEEVQDAEDLPEGELLVLRQLVVVEDVVQEFSGPFLRRLRPPVLQQGVHPLGPG